MTTTYIEATALLGDKNTHGGRLIAVKNSLNSEKINADLPDSCLACKIQLDRSEVIICSFYNSPKGSAYRYNINDFVKLLQTIRKSKPALICGDLNFRMQTGKQQAALTKKKTKSSKFLTKLCSDKPLAFRPVQITPLTWPSIATVFSLPKRISPSPGHTTALITMRSIFRPNAR